MTGWVAQSEGKGTRTALAADADTPPGWLAQRIPHWGDARWWHSQIDAAVAGPDPVMCNLRITLSHQELSLALHEVTGAASGANFHTWAVWGSKKAGQTIRQDDLPMLSPAAWALGTVLGAGSTAALAHGNAPRRASVSLAVGTAAGATLTRTAKALVEKAADRILGGNITVLTDIGRQTARFVSMLLDPAERSEERLEEFLAGLRPGPARSGGQDLLHGAYRHYFDASREADRDRRDELMLWANLLAILHEHQRLDPYIDASVPRPFRRFVTRRLLSFAVGSESMEVSHDVPVRGRSAFSDTLRTIETPELERFLDGPGGWDRTPNTVAGSGARDWTRIGDRMNFIVDLFRSRQSDPNLFRPPYTDSQRETILSGRVPDGPL